WHAHVNEGHGKGTALNPCLASQPHTRLALQGTVELKARVLGLRKHVPQQQRLLRGKCCVRVGISAQNLLEGLVNGRVVIDREHPKNQGSTEGGHSETFAGVTGSSSLKVAPHPGPSQPTRSEPLSS